MGAESGVPGRTLLGFQQQFQYPRLPAAARDGGTFASTDGAREKAESDGSEASASSSYHGSSQQSQANKSSALVTSPGTRAQTATFADVGPRHTPGQSAEEVQIIPATAPNANDSLPSNETENVSDSLQAQLAGTKDVVSSTQSPRETVDGEMNSRLSQTKGLIDYSSKRKPVPVSSNDVRNLATPDTSSDNLGTNGRSDRPQTGERNASDLPTEAGHPEFEAERRADTSQLMGSRQTKNRRGYEFRDSVVHTIQHPIEATLQEQLAESEDRNGGPNHEQDDQTPDPLIFLDPYDDAPADRKRRRGILLAAGEGRRQRSVSSGISTATSDSASTRAPTMSSQTPLKEEADDVASTQEWGSPSLSSSGFALQAASHRSSGNGQDQILPPADSADTAWATSQELRASPHKSSPRPTGDTSEYTNRASAFDETAGPARPTGVDGISPSARAADTTPKRHLPEERDSAFRAASTSGATWPHSSRSGGAHSTAVALEPPPLPARRRLTTSSLQDSRTEHKPASAGPRAELYSNTVNERTNQTPEWENHIMRANWEELEVARFLNDFGKHVQEVRSLALLDSNSLTQASFPTRSDWTQPAADGKTSSFNAMGYYSTYLTAFITYLSPNRMVDLQREGSGLISGNAGEDCEDEEDSEMLQSFRLTSLKANSERLYFGALPLWEALGARLRRLWRWESKIISFLSLILYTFLWWRGLLISSCVFFIIMLVLSLKTAPPAPDILREIMTRQRRRAEAAQTHAQTASGHSPFTAAYSGREAPTKYSLLAESSRTYGLQASILAATLADGHERAKNFALWRSPQATWRLLLWMSVVFFASLALKPVHLMRLPGAIGGLVFFFLAPILEYKPHWLGTEWANPFDLVFAGVPNDAQYSMDILRRRAREGKPLVGDGALLLRPHSGEHPAGPAGNESKSRTDWTQWADVILRGKGLAIHGSEILGGSRSVALPRLPVSEIVPSTSTTSALLSHLSRGINSGLQALENKSKATAAHPSQRSGSSDTASTFTDLADADGTFWAVYDGCCGHLVISADSILFRSLFAKSSRSSRTPDAAPIEATADEQPLVDARTGQLTVPESELASAGAKIRVLFECKLEYVKGLKKLAPLGLAGSLSNSSWSLAAGEGLKITLRGRRGEVDFWQVRNRDEAFNRLLALAPQQWVRVY